MMVQLEEERGAHDGAGRKRKGVIRSKDRNGAGG